MAEERGYRRQVGTRAAAAMPLARPETFGAGVGRALEQAAGAAHREGLEDYAIARRETANSEWAGFQHGFALHREAMAEAAREARENPSDGHAARLGEAWEKSRDDLLGTITDDDMRRRAVATFEESGLGFREREAEFEDVKRVERTLFNLSDTQTIAANRIRRLDDPKDYPGELQIGHEAIEGLDLPEDVKLKAHREWDQVAGVNFLRGTIDRDPNLAKAMLGAGVFDELDPDTVEQLLNSADVEIRRSAAAAEHAANVARADFRERVRVAQAQDGQGIDVSEDLPALIAEARQHGLEDVAVNLEGLAANAGFAKIYDGATPVQRERRIADLQAKGDKRSVAESRELNWLETTQGGLDGAFNRDPAGFYARTSTPPPALELTDPESVAARARWARAASEAAGRPVPPLTANEAAQISATWETGRTPDQRQVLDQLAQLPADHAAAAARMVDDDPRLAVMVTLPGNYRNLALAGRDALKANGKLLEVESLDLEETMAEYDRRLAEALRVVPPAQRDAVLQVGRQIAAGLVDQTGAPLDARAYWNAINMALGATGTGEARKGGLGRWGERWFALPGGVSSEAFGSAVQRAAQDEAIFPVNPDNSRATLSRAFPVAVGNGLYEFHTASGAVVMKNTGGPWRIRVGPR